MRIKRGQTVRKRHKKLLAQAKGFRTSRKTSVKLARQAVLKAGQYAFRDRRAKKRSFRSLWISRMSAGLAQLDIKYNQFIKKLKERSVELDRKILAQLAVQHEDVFERIVKEVAK